jgi:DUF917 family protein
MRTVDTDQDIQDMARGAVLLGTGGGGDPYVGELFLRAQLKRGRKATIIDAAEVDDDAFVVSIAGIGSPPVLVEHLVSDKLLMRVLARAETLYGRRIDALISAEIGGFNSTMPLALSAISGIPTIDGDGVGRAVPHLEMTTFSIFGARVTPALLMDELGNIATIETVDDRTAEDMARAISVELGASTISACYPMSGRQMKLCAVKGSIELTLQIGRRIRMARERSADIFADLLAYLNAGGRYAAILFDGKIVDVTHETRDGWHFGKATLRGLIDPTDELVIEVQNEFTVARRNGRTVAMVPDLISVLDRETGEPLTSEMLSYGQRVKVLGYAADPLLRRPESLEVLGPRLFGINEDYGLLEDLAKAHLIPAA